MSEDNINSPETDNETPQTPSDESGKSPKHAEPELSVPNKEPSTPDDDVKVSSIEENGENKPEPSVQHQDPEVDSNEDDGDEYDDNDEEYNEYSHY